MNLNSLSLAAPCLFTKFCNFLPLVDLHVFSVDVCEGSRTCDGITSVLLRLNSVLVSYRCVYMHSSVEYMFYFSVGDTSHCVGNVLFHRKAATV